MATEEFTESEVLKYYETTIGIELPPATMGGWSNLPCPIHGGERPNFGVHLETGRWNCFSGCGEGGSIYDFEMRLSECEFAEAKERVHAIIQGTAAPTAPKTKNPGITNTTPAKQDGVPAGAVREDFYYYERPDGILAYGIERLRLSDGSKLFVPLHNKKGKPVRKLPGQTYLYHLPEVIKAETVLVVEGEKCVDVVRNALGGTLGKIAATCNPGGAEKWEPEYSQYLKGKHVLLCPDNDAPGRKHIHKVARSVRGITESLKVVEVPGDEGSDIADYLEDYLPDALPALTKLMETATPYRAPSRAQIVRFDQLEGKVSDWLWHPYIPAGNLTMMSAEPGTGKTTVACSIAAHVTAGEPFIVGNNLYNRVGNVIYLTAEDSYAETILPRFENMGGIVERMFGIDGKLQGEGGHEKELPISLQDVDELEDAIIELKPRLIVVDPIQAYLGDDVNMNLASDVRPVLAGLKRLAEKYTVAVLCIRHLSKDTKRLATHRGLGTIDFNAACRSEVFLGKHPDDPDERVMCHIKHNLTRKGDSVGYRISEGPDGQMVFEWTGKSDITEELIAESKQGESGALQQACDFLKHELLGGGMDATAVKNIAKEHGISERTLRRAKEKLGVKSVIVDASKNKWNWKLVGNANARPLGQPWPARPLGQTGEGLANSLGFWLRGLNYLILINLTDVLFPAWPKGLLGLAGPPWPTLVSAFSCLLSRQRTEPPGVPGSRFTLLYHSSMRRPE